MERPTKESILKQSYYLSRKSICYCGPCGPTRVRASSLVRFLDHTQTYHIPVGLLWTSDQLVAETCTWQHTTLTTDMYLTTQHTQQTCTWKHTALTTDLYLTTYNTHNRPVPDNTQHSQQTSTPSAGFEPTLSVGERLQTVRPLGSVSNRAFVQGQRWPRMA